MWGEIIALRALCENFRAFLRLEHAAVFADEIDPAFHPVPIDRDADAVAFAQFSEWTAGERFGTDMADARAGADAAETRIGQQRDIFAERQMLERARELVGFLHAGAH